MPKYTKFLKDQLKRKDRLGEVSSIPLMGECSAVVLNRVPEKLSNPGVFTIPVLFGSDAMSHALADLGASINFMSYSLYEKLELGELTPIRMSLSLADHSVKYPRGIIENFLVKVDKFLFLVDFMVLDMEADEKLPIILIRPFLRTAKALIDVYDGKITLWVGDENITYDVARSMKDLSDQDDFSGMDKCFDYICGTDLVESNSLVDCDDLGEDELCVNDSVNEISCESEAGSEEKPAPLELKVLPSHLEYALLDEGSNLLVIVSSKMTEEQKTKLIDVLKLHKGEIACRLSDIQEGIVLGYKISRDGIEVDRANIDTISRLLPPTNVKAIKSFLGYAGFYRRFIKDFSKITRPMTRLLEKDVPYVFDDECLKAFTLFKEKLVSAPILCSPNWSLLFELMCDASDYTVGVVLGQRRDRHFHPIYYASKTLNNAQENYTTTEKEKKDDKPRLIRWILLLSDFEIEIKDRKGAENVAANHLSRLEDPRREELREEDIGDTFPHESIDFVAAEKQGYAYATKEEILPRC
ncbi:uncharacterized protein LOC143564389 [Bidens hawaiensis]|uniref:uncharacterized protein LOC143564389 n=1 Tax=Bidens hawaiensis TaxID=980011 RepID=UPI0040497E96